MTLNSKTQTDKAWSILEESPVVQPHRRTTLISDTLEDVKGASSGHRVLYTLSSFQGGNSIEIKSTPTHCVIKRHSSEQYGRNCANRSGRFERFDPSSSRFCYNSAISACARSSQWQTSIGLLDELTSLSMFPTETLVAEPFRIVSLANDSNPSRSNSFSS